MKLSLKNVTKSYGSVVALRPTSLDVPEGEFLTLLGPSGSGKSTMLQLLSGLTPTDGGKILIDGVDATQAPPQDRGIGFVFQNYALFPHLTVEENIAFPLEMRRTPKREIQKRIRNVLEVVGLPDKATCFPNELSGGQQQRVAFARCAVYEPSVILMDEPLGALDKRLRDQMQSEIKRIHKTLGATILYVTHDQEEAMAMSDRICVMNHGGIEQVGTPWEVYFRPRSIFSAEFVGSANLLGGKVVEISGRSASIETSGGTRVRAALADKRRLEIGNAITVMLRPESIDILEDGVSAANMLVGVVKDVAMLGAFTRLEVQTQDNLDLTIVRFSQADEVIKRGQAVRLGWSCDSTIVLESDGYMND